MEKLTDETLKNFESHLRYPDDSLSSENVLRLISEIRRLRKAVERRDNMMAYWDDILEERDKNYGLSREEQEIRDDIEAMKKGEGILKGGKSDGLKELEKKHPLGIPDSDGGL